MSVLIFANGEILETDWIAPFLDQATITIAADGGIRHLKSLGRVPDVVIGDLDSVASSMRADLQTSGTAVIAHPSLKDETDLELALTYAAEHSNHEILVFGSLGGRLDQTLSNILLLAHPALEGRRVKLVEPWQRAWLVDRRTEIRGQIGDSVSLIPLSGDVRIESTTGLQWELRGEDLVFALARGISNVMTADVATVVLKSGRLLCVHIRKEWMR